MEYLAFKDVEDFVFNLSFQKWILYGEPEATQFWETWVSQHPGQHKVVNDAKAIIFALKLNFTGLPEDQIQLEIKKIMLKLQREENIGSLPDAMQAFRPRAQNWKKHWVVLTSTLVVIAATFFWEYQRSGDQFQDDDNNTTPYNHFPSPAKDFIVHTNQSDSTELFILPDQSRIFLARNCSIRYAKKFQSVNREINMTGEAFFEVKPDAAHPFLVITNVITTKVLGTSFTVKAEKGMDPVVFVKTGKVSVFKTTDHLQEPVTSAGVKAIVLTPNQAVTYSEDSKGFIKTLVEKPVMISDSLKVKFSFERTPLKNVFRTLQDAYGIPVIYDEETIASCSLSAVLGNESFFEKLDMICRATNANYEKIDGNIVITSTGCR